MHLSQESIFHHFFLAQYLLFLLIYLLFNESTISSSEISPDRYLKILASKSSLCSKSQSFPGSSLIISAFLQFSICFIYNIVLSRKISYIYVRIRRYLTSFFPYFRLHLFTEHIFQKTYTSFFFVLYHWNFQ